MIVISQASNTFLKKVMYVLWLPWEPNDKQKNHFFTKIGCYGIFELIFGPAE